MLIIAVAVFSIAATLTMVVFDKQSDIAVLRTIGASSKSIIFMIQGSVVGLLGIILGNIVGVWLSRSIADIVCWAEAFFLIDLMSCEIYAVCDFPSEIHSTDLAADRYYHFYFMSYSNNISGLACGKDCTSWSFEI